MQVSKFNQHHFGDEIVGFIFNVQDESFAFLIFDLWKVLVKKR